MHTDATDGTDILWQHPDQQSTGNHKDISILLPWSVEVPSHNHHVCYGYDNDWIDSYRPSENKVNRSFDIAILVILTALLAIRIKGILITEKRQFLKNARSADTNRQQPVLPALPSFQSDVLHKIRSINVATRRSWSSHILTKFFSCWQSHHLSVPPSSPIRDIYFGFRNNNLSL